MAKSYQGAAALTMIRSAAGGGYLYVYEGDPVPEGVDSDDLKRLVDEKFLVEVEAVEAPASSEQSSDSGSGPSIKDILAEVGDDKTKAAAALEQEQERGDDARQTLVKKLQAIVDAS